MATTVIETRRGTRELGYEHWDGRRLSSGREFPLAFDLETAWVEDPRQVPDLALVVASDGKSTVVVHPDDLGRFLLVHRDSYFVGHNVQFDFWVADRHLGLRGEADARDVLWDACDRGRLFDTQVLDMLLQLATGRYRHAPDAGAGGADETKVYPGSLADVAADYTALRICKDDPYRRRYGELVGLPADRWRQVEEGFFAYAARDGVTTRRLYPALAARAYELMAAHGYKRDGERYDIRPDAMAEFGYLSEVIQVKASVVLAYMFRHGVGVDLDKARALETKLRVDLDGLVEKLQQAYPDVLTYERDGSLRLTPKSRTPSLGTTKLVSMLGRVVEEVRAQGTAIDAPVREGKTAGVSMSVKQWARYADLHPFLGLWIGIKNKEKLLGFFAALTSSVLHGEYSLLTRTGRTACAKPKSDLVPGLNFQQMPRDPEFRSLFVPRPASQPRPGRASADGGNNRGNGNTSGSSGGNTADATSPDGADGQRIFTGDYAYAELRTLAAVCRARFGSSRLGDVIAAGTDPHAHTAAAIQDMPLADFMALARSDPGRYRDGRQAAKALNFGIPGGLGVETLRTYAREKYRVSLTPDEAAKFKARLISDVYPELNDRDGYLADPSMAALARNLGVAERQAWEAFDRTGRREPFVARGVVNVVRGQSTASDFYQATVWEGLHRLAKTVQGLDADLAESIAREQGGQRLHGRLYHQDVATLTGRIRAGVGFTDGKNTPFQSLCADGAKLALWDLLYAGFDVLGFIHDEILVQLAAAGGGGADGDRIERIMVAAMERVMGHGVPADCEFAVAGCWSKP